MQLKTMTQLHLFVTVRTLQNSLLTVLRKGGHLLLPFSWEKTTVQLEHKTQDLATRLHIYSFSAFPWHWNTPSSQLLLYQQEETNPAKTLTCHTMSKGHASLSPTADLHSPTILLSPHTWLSLPCLKECNKNLWLAARHTKPPPKSPKISEATTLTAHLSKSQICQSSRIFSMGILNGFSTAICHAVCAVYALHPEQITTQQQNLRKTHNTTIQKKPKK